MKLVEADPGGSFHQFSLEQCSMSQKGGTMV